MITTISKDKVLNLNRVLIIFVIIGSILPNFAFSQTTPEITQPQTLEEVKEIGEKALEKTQKELPGILERIWKGEVLPFWQKMFNWFKRNIFSDIENWFEQKFKPQAEKEFEKEKEEMKKELPEVTKSLWEKFRELIK